MLFNQNLLATEYYVDSSKGIDSNPGTTINSPWKTIAKANNILKAGDILNIRSGSYDSQIKPLNSGTSTSSYITYRRYPDDPEWSVKISTSSYGAYLTGKSFIKFDGLYFYSTGSYWILTEETDYCVFQNCRFYDTKTSWTGILIKDGSDFNKIINCIFDDAPILNNWASCNYWDQDCQDEFDSGSNMSSKCDCLTAPADMLKISGNTGSSVGNIVEDSIFGKSCHESITVSSDGTTDPLTVIRNNIVENVLHSGISVFGKSLVEKNIITGMGSEKEKNPYKRDREVINGAALYIMKNEIILRKNVVEAADYGLYFGARTSDFADNMRIYHNTLYNNLLGIFLSGNNTNDYTGTILVNNVIFDDSNLRASNLIGSLAGYHAQLLNIYDGTYTVHNKFKNNSWTPNKDKFYFKNQRTTARSLDYLIANHSNELNSDNFQAYPYFADPAKKDFSLTSNSTALIDDGAWLTTVTSATASGTKFVVADSLYFYDGWNIPGEVGDVIKTQNQQRTTIQSIDYETNTLYVYPGIDTAKGEGISIDFLGTSPDIGALEYKVISQIVDQPKGVMVVTNEKF